MGQSVAGRRGAGGGRGRGWRRVSRTGGGSTLGSRSDAGGRFELLLEGENLSAIRVDASDRGQAEILQRRELELSVESLRDGADIATGHLEVDLDVEKLAGKVVVHCGQTGESKIGERKVLQVDGLFRRGCDLTTLHLGEDVGGIAFCCIGPHAEAQRSYRTGDRSAIVIRRKGEVHVVHGVGEGGGGRHGRRDG